MKFYILRLTILITAVAIQNILLTSVMVEQSKPDLLLLVVLFLGLRGGPMTGQVSGFVGGLLEHAFLPIHTFGVNSLVKTIIGYLAGKLNKNVHFQSFVPIFLLGLFATMVKGIFIIVINLILSLDENEILDYVINQLLIELLLNAILAPLVFWMLGKINLNLYVRED